METFTGWDMLKVTFDLIIMVTLVIITFVSLRGFFLFRERNLATISFAFGILMAYGILVCAYDFIVSPTGRSINMSDQGELFFLSLVDNLFTIILLLIPLAISLIIYSFYREKSNREFLLSGKKLAIIIGCLLVLMAIAVFLGPDELSMLGFSTLYFTQVYMLYDSTAGYYVMILLQIWAYIIAILLIFLLYGLVMKYQKTKNRNMRWVIFGFTFLFLVFIMPVDLIISVISRLMGGFWGPDLSFVANLVIIVPYAFLVLSYVSFLISLIKTRHVKQ